jgi:Gas vesicle synthesis protein GvpO
MADQQRNSKSRNGSGGGSSSRGRGGERRRSRDGMSAREAVQHVHGELPALLGKPVESVLGVQRDDEDGWHVIVQVVELSRIPNSTDVLGAYLVTLDDDGEIEGWQRQRRYVRSQPDED